MAIIPGFEGKVLGVTDQVANFWRVFALREYPFAILDIILVAIIIYYVYAFLKETRAMRIVYGIIILFIFMLLGRLLQLSALNFILKYILTLIAVAIPVVFQPELRSLLERLGRTQLVADFRLLRKAEIEEVIRKIVEAATVCAKNQTGALIVIGQRTGLREYIETGTPLEAHLSTELLLNIFTSRAPLHDGAAIIMGNKIMAASCTLPLSDSKFDYHLGTRHRAALGLTTVTDAIVVVVSEENGMISVAVDGVLKENLTSEGLTELLTTLLKGKPKPPAERKEIVETYQS